MGSGAAPESTNTARTPQNPVDGDLYGRLWIAAFETRASCNQPIVMPLPRCRPPRTTAPRRADLYQVTETVLERPDELSRRCTPVDSPAPLVLPYTAAGRRALAPWRRCGQRRAPSCRSLRWIGPSRWQSNSRTQGTRSFSSIHSRSTQRTWSSSSRRGAMTPATETQDGPPQQGPPHRAQRDYPDPAHRSPLARPARALRLAQDGVQPLLPLAQGGQPGSASWSACSSSASSDCVSRASTS
jgi:hypothetical protein